jgi:type II secretory pathway component PulM
MKARLRTWWEARPPRDRVLIAVFAAVVGAVFYLWLIQAAGHARVRLGASVSALRAEAARLERDAAELARVRALRPPPAAQSDLRAHLQAQISTAGLAGGLLRIDAADANHAQVAFGSVPFADWLEWVAALQAQHIRLEVARIEALQTPGLVGVTATFARPQAR